MHILFLNQYFPPDPAPTGILLRELADRLMQEGHSVDFVGTHQDYHQGQKKGGRMFRELKALGAMLWAGLKARRPDLVISASSPPCLLVVATLLAWRFRARSLHWIMDLYPEIAIALEELQPGFLSSLITRIMGVCYRACDGVIGLDADMAGRVRQSGVKAAVIRPWVFKPLLASMLEEKAPIAPWSWVYSGNLGRAHEWETLLRAQAFIEMTDPEIRLVFQGGGPAWPAAQAFAQAHGIQRCDWVNYVAQDQLCASLLSRHCLVATLRPSVQGMLWPSKLGLLMNLPRPLVWVGPKQGAIARQLRMRPQTASFEPGDAFELAQWILALRNQAANPRMAPECKAQSHREESLNRWVCLVNSTFGSSPNSQPLHTALL